MDATSRTLEGRRFGGYQVLGLVHRRMSVETYRARQVAVNRLVDLTVLPPDAARKPAAVLRFERALSVTGRLRHDNVAAAIDAGAVDGWRYFVTEHVEGTTLADALARGDTISRPRALEIAHDVARAIAHLEEVGVVHRGVSPASIVLSDAGPAKLTEFVWAKSRTPEEAETWFDADTEGAAYVSPDRIRGDKGLDARGDVYSLGCVLYRLVAGRSPFHGANAAMMLDAHLNRRPRDPRTLLEDLPAGLVHVLDRCLRKSPELRYAKAADLVTDLAALRAGSDPPTPDTARLLWPSKNVRPSNFRTGKQRGSGPGAA